MKNIVNKLEKVIKQTEDEKLKEALKKKKKILENNKEVLK